MTEAYLAHDPFSSYWFYLILAALASIRGYKNAIKCILSGSATYLILFSVRQIISVSEGTAFYPSISVAMSVAMMPFFIQGSISKKAIKVCAICLAIALVIANRLIGGHHTLIEITFGLFTGLTFFFLTNSLILRKRISANSSSVPPDWPNSIFIPTDTLSQWSRAEVAERYPDVASPLFSDLFLTNNGRAVQKMAGYLKIKRKNSVIGYSLKDGLIYSNMGPSILNFFRIISLFLNIREKYIKYFNIDYQEAKTLFWVKKNKIEISLNNSRDIKLLYCNLIQSLKLFESWMFHQSVSLFYHTFPFLSLKLWTKIHFPLKSNEILSRLTQGLKTPTFNESCILYDLGKELSNVSHESAKLTEKAKELLNLYIEKAGDKFPGYDFVEKSWRELPDKILNLSQSVYQMSEPPSVLYERQKLERTKSEKILKKRVKFLHPFRNQKIYKEILKITQTINIFKEERQLQMGAAWSLVKRSILKLGEELREKGYINSVDEVFYLTGAELAWLINEGKTKSPNPCVNDTYDLKYLSMFRRNHFLFFRETKEVEESDRESVLDFRLKTILGQKEKQRDSQRILKGEYSLGGEIEGTAVVIKDSSEFGKMKEGKILVAPATNPHWDILFPLAKGLITETGSPLSHPFIKSNEYGIPAVLGIKGASKKIKDGDKIKIDGKRKIVTILR